MRKGLIVCDHAPISTEISVDSFDDVLEVNQHDPGTNLNLVVTNLTHRIVSSLKPVARDLLDLASYVCWADGTLRRGTEKDVYAERWRRGLTFLVPVRQLDLWNGVRKHLEAVLEFLTGDSFTFSFSDFRATEEQMTFEFPETALPFAGADSVCLFSGGIDSLAGAVQLLCKLSRKPVLVSHRSSPKVDSQQKRLVRQLQAHLPPWSIPHLSIWVNRRGKKAVEFSQRSRAFLYLAIATAVATELGLADVFLCENGPVSFNLPKSGQSIGTMLSRSTHPDFINQYQSLVRHLFRVPPQVHNPFIFKTKAEVARTVVQAGVGELLPATFSCTHTEQATKVHPHCGTCSQCVDRRFALSQDDLAKFDPVGIYEKDIFIDNLREGSETTYAENYVRFALEIDELDDRSFFSKFGELGEVVTMLPGTSDDVGKKIFDMYKLHAREVIAAMRLQYAERQEDHLKGRLPKTCLLSMVATLRHLEPPLSILAQKIAQILERSLPLTFRRRKARNETAVQDAAEASLKSAEERLTRESPTLSYAVVKTVPDFADTTNRLFVEMKYPKTRRDVNRIVTEMTSRVTIYRDQGAEVLFFVYDPNRAIGDDTEFCSAFLKHRGIHVKVAR